MFLEVMMTINLALTLVLVVSFAIVTLDQRKRIAALEARLWAQPPVEFVDGQNRLLTMVPGFVDHAGMVRTNEDMKLESEFAGMPVGIYVVATARRE